jgi:hypothetical protein
MPRAAAFAMVSLILMSQAIAGTPLEEEVICPVGEEKFTITGTLSCSTLGGAMSLRQVTSCDFVTRLPVCPTNGLPLYREFDEDEIEMLTAFVSSETYLAFRDKSPYLRAHAVEKHLEGEDGQSAFWVLQQGLWYDRDALLAEPGVIDVYFEEALREKGRMSAEDKPYLLAAIAYQLAGAGRDADAEVWLAEARAVSDGSDFLNQYITSVSNCIDNMTTPECGPEAPFDP